MKPLPEADDELLRKAEGFNSKPVEMAKNPANTKVVLPYALVNRTDLQIVVRRLIKRDQAEKTKSFVLEAPEAEQTAESIVKKKRHLTNVYRVP
mmetsp:Transcript_21720/g.33477  ORF Transcript_21720/g.33477 Transcript_21720/m.33477 type:complete len:94 (+) Transcript_21720:8075-8356(+)